MEGKYAVVIFNLANMIENIILNITVKIRPLMDGNYIEKIMIIYSSYKLKSDH